MEETILPLKSVQKVIGLETVSSTQDLALELARNGEPEGTLVLACEQTAARRHEGTRFHAAEGGVYFTLILRPERTDLCAASLSRRAVRSVADALTELFGIKTKIKEPNAVLAWDTKAKKWKKIAGVLVETFFEPEGRFALVGMGINVNNRVSNGGKEPMTGVKQLLGMEISKELFLEEMLPVFWKHYAHWLCSVQ